MNIVVCLPGRQFSSNFLKRWTDFMNYCHFNGHNIMLSQQYSCNIYYVRNMCLGADVLKGKYQKPFNGEIDYDYMLWIDSDIIFSPQDLEKLLNHKRDIVGGLYRMENYTQFAAVQTWDMELFKKTGGFRFITDDDLVNQTNLIEVSYTGFGFLLIKKGVFESLQYPWFRPHFTAYDDIEDFSMEDVGFCKDAINAGYKIYIDPTLIVGHEKTLIL